ncbi:MAG: heat-inducible transcriptional repressor HrcA [Acidimicrobiia bacterium]|nr:heat-inducible transcriptional repressor HrcA [Acidimicrobiia bacterium]
MPETETLSTRKAAILRAVVEGYISTSRPVGSTYVTRSSVVNVSSATVRKEMLALEDEGYLHQPHTSAGRIPTEKGYRQFVDALVEPTELGVPEARQVSAFFDEAHGEIERLLGHTTELLANLTRHTALLVGPGSELAEIRSVQLVAINPHVALVVVVTADGRVDKHPIELPVGADGPAVEAASRTIAARLTGTKLGSFTADEPSGDAVVDSIVSSALVALASDDSGSPVFVEGASHVAEAFDAIETVRGVLAVLEKQFVVVSLVRDVLDRGMRVAIGTETGSESLNECSLIVTEYSVDGEAAGSIGLLGPTRMNYPQAIAAVAAVGRELSSRLSEQ